MIVAGLMKQISVITNRFSQDKDEVTTIIVVELAIFMGIPGLW